MGSFLDKPKTEKSNESGHGNDLSYGLSAMQGWRIEMEDSHRSIIGIPGLPSWSFFAVFDGHAGSTVSKFSSEELLSSILHADPDIFTELGHLYSSYSTHNNQSNLSSNNNNNNSNNKIKNSNSTTKLNNSSSNLNDSLNNLTNNHSTTTDTNAILNNSTKNETNTTNSTLETPEIPLTPKETIENEHLSNTNTTDSESKTNKTTKILEAYTTALDARLKEAIRKGFLELDERIRERPEFDRGEDKSGSTAVACLISPTHVYLINCGDSRAILISNNQVTLNTLDHKPVNPNERERIQNAGGSVMIQRVNGSLAVSRALGDYEYKCVSGRGPCEQLVSPEPEVYSCERTDKDEFVVLACDGSWDVLSNEDLKEFIHSRLRVTNDLVKISNEVLDLCLNKVCHLIAKKKKKFKLN